MALHTADDALGDVGLRRATNGVLGALVALGLVTYCRMLRRSLVTDQYKDALKYIRRRYTRLGLDETP